MILVSKQEIKLGICSIAQNSKICAKIHHLMHTCKLFVQFFISQRKLGNNNAVFDHLSLKTTTLQPRCGISVETCTSCLEGYWVNSLVERYYP